MWLRKLMLVGLMFLAASGDAVEKRSKLFSRTNILLICSAVVVGGAWGSWRTFDNTRGIRELNRTNFELFESPIAHSRAKLLGAEHDALARYLSRHDEAQHLEILASLPPAKIAWTLRSEVYKDKRAHYFTKLAADPKTGAAILWALNTGPFNYYSAGEAAAEMLKDVPEEAQSAVLKELNHINASFAGNVVRSLKGEKVKDRERPAVKFDSGTIATSKDEFYYPEVFQNQYIFTNASHHKKVQTSGIGPCLGLSLYHPKTKTGALAHLDAGDAAQTFLSLDRIMADFEGQKIDVRELEVGLIGGREGMSEDLLWFILHRLQIEGVSFEQIKHTLLFPGPTTSMMLDLHTGEISQFNQTVSPLGKEGYRLELMRNFSSLGSPIRRSMWSLPSPFEN